MLTGATLTLQKLTITGGRLPVAPAGGAGQPGVTGIGTGSGTDSHGGDGQPGGGGGGVRSAGTLAINNVVVTDNRAGDGGLGGPSSTGGTGGSAANSNGGTGGGSRGGAGGDGGNGGGVLNAAGTTTISDSTFTDNVAGNGAVGGSSTAGGTGGAGQGNGAGGSGGPCFAGRGGTGGSGGAIDSETGTLSIIRADIEHNTAGTGGPGAPCGHGGTGGAGAGSGNGGPGGFTFPGNGGPGGDGGGVAAHAAALTLSASTIASNRDGDGANGSGTGTGGDGGAGGSGTGSGGGGNFMDSGSGGEAGEGGGVMIRSTNAGSASGVLTDDTLNDNQTGNGGNGADGTSGGIGGGDGGGGGSIGTVSDSHGGTGGEGGLGGGALFDAEFSVSNLTVTGNRAGTGGAGGAGGTGPNMSIGGGGGEGGFGGGILAEFGSLAHVTIVGNVISRGGAGGAGGTGVSPSPGASEGLGEGADLEAFDSEQPLVSLSASIIGGCGGTFTNGGGNIVRAATSCPGTAANPKLGPLAANGGPTKTIALLAGSPAIDRIAVPCGTTPDQRGVARPQGQGCDTGAYEFAPPGAITGAASHLSATGATVTAVIIPNARTTTWHIEFGSTKRYGERTPSRTLAGVLKPVVVSSALTGLRRHATVHYRVVATNGDGTSRGADRTLTTTGFGGVSVVNLKLTSSAGGVVPVIVACPPGTAGPCKGTLTMSTTVATKHGKAKAVALAHASFKVGAGSHKMVHLKLGSKGRSLLHAAGSRGLAVTLTAVARDAHGARARSIFAATLKR